MKTIIVIPARFASERFPGKPLKRLSVGGSQKSLIKLSWEAARKVKNVEEVFVATDDDRIRIEAESFGAPVVMTSKKCKNGTERCAEAIEKINIDCDIVVNFQGDAPLTPDWFVEDLLNIFKENADTEIATPVLRLDGVSLNRLKLDRNHGLVGGTTVVFDHDFNALYFSKEIIPYIDEKRSKKSANCPTYQHVGVYAYKFETLLNYNILKEGNLEVLEGLEQLRFLENGCSIKCVLVDSKGRTFWELNNPEDVQRIERAINEDMNKVENT